MSGPCRRAKARPLPTWLTSFHPPERGRPAIDEGGVRKEFFQLLVEQLFSESFGMFVNVNKGALVAEQLWFSKDCVWSDDEFELTGTLISLAVYNGVLLDLHFPPVVYKKLIALDSPQRRPLTLSDVASLDGDLAKGLTQLLEYEPAGDVEAVFCLNFEVTWTSFGATHRAELVEGGAGVEKAISQRRWCRAKSVPRSLLDPLKYLGVERALGVGVETGKRVTSIASRTVYATITQMT